MKFQLFDYTITVKRSGPLLYITKQRFGVDEQVYPVPCRCWANAFHPPTDDFLCFWKPESLPKCAFCKRRRCRLVDGFHERFRDGYHDATISYVCELHAPWHDRFLRRYQFPPVQQ